MVKGGYVYIIIQVLYTKVNDAHNIIAMSSSGMELATWFL